MSSHKINMPVIINRSIKELIPAEYNPRQINADAFEQLKRSLESFECVEPAVININPERLNVIIGGHQRINVAKSLKWKEFPCIEVNLPIEREKELNIRLNKNTGEFDMDMLANHFDVEDLVDWGFDESEFGIDVEEIGEVEGEDDVPEAPAVPIAVRGDVWILGEHRLVCGDSTSIDDVDKLMDGNKADMVFTDPPYNADYSSRVDKSRRKPWGGILNDNMSKDEFSEFLIDLNGSLYHATKDGASLYECIDWKRYPQLANVFSEAFTHKGMIIWNKNYFGLGTYYRTKHEIILFGCKGEKLNTWNAAHNEMDVWSEDREKVSNYEHPTQKPVTLPQRAIENSSNKKDIVLDLFGGSGSTLIACEKTKRKCYMMELDEKYVQVILQRWADFTGKEPILESTGQTFSEVKNEKR